MENTKGVMMSNSAIAEELSELRVLVEELRQARKDDLEKDRLGASEQPAKAADSASIPKVLTEKLGLGDAEAHVQEFITTIEEDIKDTNPMTMFVIFSLGVLAGRLLSK